MENRFEQGRFVPGVQFTFRFETHSVSPEQYEDRKETMRQLIASSFHKGQTNIFFQENMYGTKTQEDWYQSEYKTYKSHVMAQLSTILKTTEGVDPHRADIEELLTVMDRNKEKNHSFAYKMLIAEVLDEMSQGGLKAQIAFEQTANLRKKYPSPPAETLNDPLIRLLATRQQQMEQLQDSITRGIQFRAERDEVIKSQLIDHQKIAARQGRPANILVLMGNLHSGLFEQMPFKVRQASTASSEPFYIGYNPTMLKNFQAHAGLPYNLEDLLTI